tara:strand:+ start:65 stop:664 length:600 start_codon:yes stop_codon:yes gene_type:complete
MRKKYNDSWFLDAMSKEPTLRRKITKWLELEYKIFFEPITSSPKIPTPISRTLWHFKYTVPAIIKRTAKNFATSFVWYLNCYKQFWRLPNIIEGYQLKLSAQKEWHKHYKKIAEHKTRQVDNIMENTVADLVPKEDMKAIYERWDLYVPDEYLTDDEIWDSLEQGHEDYLASGGIGDFDHIYWNEEQGRKLLGGFDVER